ncbi:MAG: ABC transporter permease subunit [Actinomycetota bacterium]|nr:ABC transporter permease subunit [Actinomycetota bacterium]MDA2980822.1 ABC transporter permease subunit [Actinomycetota bacterium]MDA3003314.1 ABC transporter permease subunit [Actinomycetota bacterium]
MLSELQVMFTRRRTWAMLAAIALIPILLALAVYLSADRLAPGEGPPFVDRVTQNGLFTGFAAMLLAMPLFLPLTVSVVAGDTIAGEAGQGTLRYLLISPVGRVRLLLVKYLGTLAFVMVGTLTLMIAGALIGALLFPVGPVTLLSGDVIGLGEALGRMALVALYTTISMLGMLALGLFISTLTTIPVGAMTGVLVASGVSQILDNLPQLSVIHEFLFTHYWLDFADLLRNPIELSSMGSNLVLQLAYVATFGTLAYGRFRTQDVLS